MREAHFQAVLDRYQAQRRLPSLVVGVLSEGRLAWTGSAGHETTSDTQYRIGSITKVVTALLVMQCRDEGLLSLDDQVGRFLPETGYADATIRSLLSHTSGMQSEPVGPWWERSPGVPVEQLLATNDGSGAVFGAGEQWHYSNLGYGLLGEIVARVRGASWWELARERVLSPLGMRRTSYHPEAPYAEGHSVDHLRGTLADEPAHDTGAMAPAGQLWSTIEDLGAFAAFLCSGAPVVISDETLAEMRRPVAPADDYGLGIRTVPWSGGMLTGHTGTMPGFRALALGDPLTGAGVVALTNATTGLDTPSLALDLLGARTPGAVSPWVPTVDVPPWASALLGWWFWGSTAHELRWHNDHLELRDSLTASLQERFAWRDGRIVGVDGYHHGETLHVVAPDRLECATFVYTRSPLV